MSTSFPRGFLWGAATAAHQVEGGNVNNHYWEWENAEHSPFAEPSGDACDSYPRWREDLVAGAGLTGYRFSIEWSRIEPDEGLVSRAEIDHYGRIVDGCRDRGVTPLVTLSHFTTPRWFHRDGSWQDPKAGDRFARFTELALPIVEDAGYVVTINEPNLMACMPVLGRMGALGQPIHGLVGQEYIAEDGGEEQLATYRAAMEDQFFDVAKDDDFVGMQVCSCARRYEVSLVAARLQAFRVTASTFVEFDPQQFSHSAGLTLFYDDENWFYLRVYRSESLGGRALGILEAEGGRRREHLGDRVALPDGPVVLRADVDTGSLQFAWHRPGEAPTPIGDVLDASRLADEPLRGFTGTMVGITCQDAFRRTITADFDWFRLEHRSDGPI